MARLAEVADGRTDLPNGGVVVRTRPDPWRTTPTARARTRPRGSSRSWRRPALSRSSPAGVRDPGARCGRPHRGGAFRRLPGTNEMPWVRVLARRTRNAATTPRAGEGAAPRLTAARPVPLRPRAQWVVDKLRPRRLGEVRPQAQAQPGRRHDRAVRHGPRRRGAERAPETEDAVDCAPTSGWCGWAGSSTTSTVVDLTLYGERARRLCDRLAGYDDASADGLLAVLPEQVAGRRCVVRGVVRLAISVRATPHRPTVSPLVVAKGAEVALTAPPAARSPEPRCRWAYHWRSSRPRTWPPPTAPTYQILHATATHGAAVTACVPLL
jgi:hypothetical protein